MPCWNATKHFADQASAAGTPMPWLPQALPHTDCGITRLAGDPAMLAQYFQVKESEFAAKSVLDPYASVAIDVAVLQGVPALPANWLLSGLVYDVSTGLVKVVMPPAPIH